MCVCVCVSRDGEGSTFFQLNADFFNLKGKLSPLENQEQLYFFWFKEIAEKQRRQQLISRLPNIQCLNGTPISESEREDAERAFLRLYMDCDEKPSRWENKLISRDVTILTLNARLGNMLFICWMNLWVLGSGEQNWYLELLVLQKCKIELFSHVCWQTLLLVGIVRRTSSCQALLGHSLQNLVYNICRVRRFHDPPHGEIFYG